MSAAELECEGKFELAIIILPPLCFQNSINFSAHHSCFSLHFVLYRAKLPGTLASGTELGEPFENSRPVKTFSTVIILPRNLLVLTRQILSFVHSPPRHFYN